MDGRLVKFLQIFWLLIHQLITHKIINELPPRFGILDPGMYSLLVSIQNKLEPTKFIFYFMRATKNQMRGFKAPIIICIICISTVMLRAFAYTWLWPSANHACPETGLG